jgi:hypothetical protein
MLFNSMMMVLSGFNWMVILFSAMVMMICTWTGWFYWGVLQEIH